MINSMRTTEKLGTSIVIDFIDKENNDKAHGHINGTRHKKTGSKMLPRRDFFGISEEEKTNILKKVIKKSATSLLSSRLSEFLGEQFIITNREGETITTHTSKPDMEDYFEYQ